MYGILYFVTTLVYLESNMTDQTTSKVSPMSPQERNTYVALICNLLINGYAIIQLRSMFAQGLLDGPDAPQVWARMIVWVILAAIALTIVLTILFNVVFAIATGDKTPSFLSDERDKMFEVRAMGMTTFIMVAAFLGCIIALALDYSALTAFLVLYFGMAAGSLAGDFVKLASYRHGG